MERFSVTYEVVTPESAEQGDAEERGFCSPGGWQHPDRTLLTLREALAAAQRHYSRRYGAGFEDSGRWWSTMDADENCRTGEHTSYSIHPPDGITAASYRRVTRVLCGR